MLVIPNMKDTKENVLTRAGLNVLKEAMREGNFALNHKEVLSISSMLAVAKASVMHIHVCIGQQIDYRDHYCANPKGRRKLIAMGQPFVLPDDFAKWVHAKDS